MKEGCDAGSYRGIAPQRFGVKFRPEDGENRCRVTVNGRTASSLSEGGMVCVELPGTTGEGSCEFEIR